MGERCGGDKIMSSHHRMIVAGNPKRIQPKQNRKRREFHLTIHFRGNGRIKIFLVTILSHHSAGIVK